MRICRTCKRQVAAEGFYLSAPNECKDCRNGRTAASRRADPETARRYSRDAYRRGRADRIAEMPRVCEACGDGINPERASHSKFCCRQCALDAQETRRKAAVLEARAGRLCARCGEEIPVTRYLSAKTCSAKCRDALNERARMHDRCRRLSHYAIRVGRLVRQPCEVCGSVDVEMHHVDYFEPLNVTWLCFLHHRTEMHGQRVRQEL